MMAFLRDDILDVRSALFSALKTLDNGKFIVTSCNFKKSEYNSIVENDSMEFTVIVQKISGEMDRQESKSINAEGLKEHNEIVSSIAENRIPFAEPSD